MSSDSEVDEFFDAEDVTPNTPSVLERMVSTSDDSELDKEERELLQLQRLQEDRRRKEDQELRSRLEALNMKKRGHKEKTLESDRNEQAERRRRKHEELRKSMIEKSESSESPPLSSSDSDYNDVESNMQFGLNDIQEVPQKEENYSDTPPTSLMNSKQSIDHDDYSVNINSLHPEKERVCKHLHDLVEEKSKSDTIDHNFDVQNIIEDVLQESQLLSDDNGANQPDIVRSTKTRSPPNTLQSNTQVLTVKLPPTCSGEKSELAHAEGKTSFLEPVAPPRKRKKLKPLVTGMLDSLENLPTSQRSSVSSLPSIGYSESSPEPQSPGLPPESITGCVMDVQQIAVDLEHSLDLRSVIRSGKKHIKSEDAEIEAVNSDHDSPRATLETIRSGSKCKTASLDRSSGGRSNSKTSSLDREVRLNEGLSMDREARDAKLSVGSSLDHEVWDAKLSKGSSMDKGDARLSTCLSVEKEGKHSKGSSLERDGKLSKGSSIEREGKKSKNTSLDRHKTSSMEKNGRRRSRNSSSCHDNLSRKESLNRPRTGSGVQLTDEEILSCVMVKNLDTGELVALKDADKKLPKCVDPLVLHIMERTNEYPSDEGSDRDYDARSESGYSITAASVKKKGKRLKKLFGRKVGKTYSKVKSVADQVMHGEENSTIVEGEVSEDGRRFKFKANHNKKGPYDFGQLKSVQDLSGEHTGAVWCMKFSPCGRLLATGGQDCVLRIWVLDSAFNYFDDMRQKYVEMKVSPAPSQESLSSIPSVSDDQSSMDLGATAETIEDRKGPFKTKPFCKYRGHTADLLDVSWSKNYFILSSSMDKTVRLWHISRRECLCTFQHVDFVTSIVFHPRDDRYFLSGSLDGKIRLWNIPDKKVTLWNDVGSGSLITTANFCHNGKFAVVGTYDGKCIFYSTEHLKYYTQIHVRSTRGKNSRGRKITGIEPLPGEDKVLVTSNDSRVRLYDLRDLTLTCKYKGPTNTSSQIRASFSCKGKYVICGSEDQFVYLWRTQHEFYKFSSARRDRNDYYEAFKVHNAVVTVALFAPNSNHFLHIEDSNSKKSKDTSPTTESTAEYIISADLTGCIKVIRAK